MMTDDDDVGPAEASGSAPTPTRKGASEKRSDTTLSKLRYRPVSARDGGVVIVESEDRKLLESAKDLRGFDAEEMDIEAIDAEGHGASVLMASQKTLEKMIAKIRSTPNRESEEITASQLKEFIQAEYRSRFAKITNPFDPQQPFEMDSHYVNLAISIQRKKDGEQNQEQEARQQRISNKEELTEYESIEDIDKYLNSLANESRNKIEAPAGAGKSTFCSWLAYRWGKGECLTQFEFVFLIRLRDFRQEHDELDFIPMLNKLCGLNLSAAQQEQLKINISPKKTLMILDGLDELALDLHFSDHGAWNRLLRFSIIVTSRPSMVDTEIPACKSLQLNSLTSLQAYEFIERYFKSEQQKLSKELQAFLGGGFISNFANTPLLLNIICRLWQSTGKRKLYPGISRTELFTAITAEDIGFAYAYHHRCNNAVRNGLLEKKDILSWDEIQNTLSLLAYTAYKGKVVNISSGFRLSIWESEDFLSDYIKKLEMLLLFTGLLVSEESSTEAYAQKSFHFIHQRFAEYYAARYAVKKMSQLNKEAQLAELSMLAEVREYHILDEFDFFFAGWSYVKKQEIFYLYYYDLLNRGVAYVDDIFSEILIDGNIQQLSQDNALLQLIRNNTGLEKVSSNKPRKLFLSDIFARYGRLKTFIALEKIGLPVFSEGEKSTFEIALESSQNEIVIFLLEKILEQNKREILSQAFCKLTNIDQSLWLIIHSFCRENKIDLDWQEALGVAVHKNDWSKTKFLLQEFPQRYELSLIRELTLKCKHLDGIKLLMPYYFKHASIETLSENFWQHLLQNVNTDCEAIKYLLTQMPENYRVASAKLAVLSLKFGIYYSPTEQYLNAVKLLQLNCKEALTEEDWSQLLQNVNTDCEATKYLINLVPKNHLVVAARLSALNSVDFETINFLISHCKEILTDDDWNKLLHNMAKSLLNFWEQDRLDYWFEKIPKIYHAECALIALKEINFAYSSLVNYFIPYCSGSLPAEEWQNLLKNCARSNLVDAVHIVMEYMPESQRAEAARLALENTVHPTIIEFLETCCGRIRSQDAQCFNSDASSTLTPSSTSPALGLLANITQTFQAFFGNNLQKDGKPLLVKVLMVSGFAAGKSPLRLRYTDNTFDPSLGYTVGIDFGIKMLTIDQQKIKLQIWDSTGNERFISINEQYYPGVAIYIVCYDLTRANWKSVDRWCLESLHKSADHRNYLLVGTKKDLADLRKVTYEEALEFSKEIGALGYIESSAKTGEGVTEVFQSAAELGYFIETTGRAYSPTLQATMIKQKAQEGKAPSAAYSRGAGTFRQVQTSSASDNAHQGTALFHQP